MFTTLTCTGSIVEDAIDISEHSDNPSLLHISLINLTAQSFQEAGDDTQWARVLLQGRENQPGMKSKDNHSTT